MSMALLKILRWDMKLRSNDRISVLLGTRDVIAELFHSSARYCHVFEHSFQLGCELATAFVLQFGNHVLLAVVRHAFVE